VSTQIVIIVFVPLLAALIAGLGNRMLGNVAAKSITTGALLLSAGLSWPIFLGFLSGSETAAVVPVLKWVESGTLSFDWALRVDTLTAIMLVVINSVSALVHLYSWGYMEEDPDQPRFFAYLSLFTFAMLMLVTADNLVQMFFGWEGVGLASYLLIGFWFKKPSAGKAAIKAFVVNRVGDLGFMLGIFGTYLVFQTTSIPEILAAAPAMSGSTITFVGLRLYTMDILCILLFIGAMGKSAQLGYMFLAAGVGAYGAAMFHLFTHAFFKALLFLGAGSVIHAMHHEQDMRYYGGLRKHIPFTFYAMLAGTLAITGLGVYHLGVGFAGFWSKDAILEVAFARGNGAGQFAFWAGAIAALLTSFYSWRLMFLTFWGKPRWIESEHIQHSVHKTPEQAGADTTGGYHPHESPVSMLIPLGLLTIGAIAAGQVFAPAFLDSAAFWDGSIFYNEDLIHAMHAVPYWVKYTALIVMLIGFAGAYVAYIAKPDIPAKFVATFGALHNFVYRKWYFDELYDAIFVKPAFWLGRKFWQLGDVGTIDRFGPNGIAWVVERGAGAAKSIQSGYVYTYALIMLLGLVAAVTFVLL